MVAKVTEEVRDKIQFEEVLRPTPPGGVTHIHVVEDCDGNLIVAMSEVIGWNMKYPEDQITWEEIEHCPQIDEGRK